MAGLTSGRGATISDEVAVIVPLFASATTDSITAAATAAAAVAATGALFYAGRQLQLGRAATLSGVLFSIDETLRKYATVHTALRPGGKWADPGTGPQTPEEWAEVEGYLGTFERIAVLLQTGALRKHQFKALYGYRLTNAWANDKIRAKITTNASGWTSLIRLSADLGIPSAIEAREQVETTSSR